MWYQVLQRAMVNPTSSYSNLSIKKKVVSIVLVVILASIYYGIKTSIIKIPELRVSFKMQKPGLNISIQSEHKEQNLAHTCPCIATKISARTTKENFRTDLPKKGRLGGIFRTMEEQRTEAIEILSLAVESAAAKNRKVLDKDRKCDWTDGTWVKDTSAKHGIGILKGYKSCRLDSRQNCWQRNTSTPYLGYRWVLNDAKCEAKRVKFTRRLFLSTVRDKSILFIGDSLSRGMFQSLACLLHVPDDKRKTIEERMFRYRYPDFGVTLEYIVSHWLVNETRKHCDSDPKTTLAKQPCLDVKNVDETWAGRAKDFDIFMFATGGWWEHDLQMRQASEGDRSYRKSRAVLRQALLTVMNYLGRPEFKNKEVYWRCSEVSHFFGGEWNSGGKCLRDTPSVFPIYNAVSLFIQEAVIDSLLNSASNIKLLDITKMSSYRQDAHPSSQRDTAGRPDCKHWCLPGVPDHWNEIWLNMLRDVKQNL